jgi:hypothetical protein
MKSSLYKRATNYIRRHIEDFMILKRYSYNIYTQLLAENITNLPDLPPQDSEIVATLKREGIVITSLQQLNLPLTPELLNGTQAILPELAESSVPSSNSYYILANSSQIMRNPEVFLWGLNERLISIVENYLGLPVAYHGAYIRRDMANGVQIKSRLWHTDMEDYRSIKIILYLHDVDETNGVFEYIPKALMPEAIQLLNYRFGYLPERQIERVVPSAHWQTCTGTSGTLLLVDTANLLHRGRLPLLSDRYTIFFDYTSRVPKRPYYCKSSLPVEDLIRLSDRLSPSQKQCIFWQ